MTAVAQGRTGATFRLGLLAALIALLLTACESPPPPTPVDNVIGYGETVQGSLSPAQSRWFFLGKAGEIVAVVFSATGTPPPVALIGPSGESYARVAENTGRLDNFRLPEDGQYMIVVGAGVGDYAVTLRRVSQGELPTATPLPQALKAAPGKALNVGDSRLGSLKTPEAEEIWSFEGHPGQVISIQMSVSSGDINPALRLYGPDGSIVASDDGNAASRSALISGLSVTSAGTYLIDASGKGQTGDYVLALASGVLPTLTPLPASPVPASSRSTTPAPTEIPAATSGAVVRPGDTLQGDIADRQQVDRFAIVGRANEQISIGVWPTAGSALVPSFILYGPDGSVVASSAAATGVTVSGYTLPATGAYILYLHGNQNLSTGAYSLSVGDGLTLRDVQGGTLSPETPIQGNLPRSGDQQSWTLTLPANATISVEADPGGDGIQPLLEVNGPDGRPLERSVTDPTTHAARIASLLTPQAGQYTVKVNGVPGKDIGSYTLALHVLNIAPTDASSSTVNQTIQGKVAQDERYTFTFKGIPGEVIRIDCRARVSGAFDPVVELYGPSGHRLAINDDANTGSTDSLLQTSLDDGSGPYTIQVHGYAMTPGEFTLVVKSE